MSPESGGAGPLSAHCNAARGRGLGGAGPPQRTTISVNGQT
jgi:hypothetical protein